VQLIDPQLWFAGKALTGPDWVTTRVPFWAEALAAKRAEPVEVLEIGSYEGRSAIVFLELLPACRLTAVDVFVDPNVEANFDANMARYPGRTTKHKGRALQHMDELYAGGRQFDVIYLDAGKVREGTLAQGALAWGLLKVGGILIFDDLLWKPEKPDRERPESAIRLFAAAFRPAVTFLPAHRSQVIMAKHADWPIHTPAPARR
jgi:predicted O-methyltransferase YrrM